MSDLRPPPLWLTPQTVRHLTNGTPAPRMADLPLERRLTDPRERAIRAGSKKLIAAIRLHHPERCGE